MTGARARVGRGFKGQQAEGVIPMDRDADGGRGPIATPTAEGRALHEDLPAAEAATARCVQPRFPQTPAGPTRDIPDDPDA